MFQKNDAWLGGVDEAIAILRLCSDEPDGLTIRALYDGDRLEPWETVLTIEGDYTTFAHLETVCLGTLARRTLITTNVVRVLEAANGKPIIFMPARFDHQRVQAGDGYAAYVAGQVTGFEIGVTSDEQASWWGGRGIGTVPHALIAAYETLVLKARGPSYDWWYFRLIPLLPKAALPKLEAFVAKLKDPAAEPWLNAIEELRAK